MLPLQPLRTSMRYNQVVEVVGAPVAAEAAYENSSAGGQKGSCSSFETMNTGGLFC